MKAFFTKIVFLLSPVILALMAVNYFGDAARLFSNQYEKRMAAIISTGRSVTNISNYDASAFQKEMVKNLPAAPDILVLGSSKSMLIGQDFFKGQRLVNSSIPGGYLREIIYTYSLYKKENKFPKKVVLGIDPWSFNEDKEKTMFANKAVKRHRADDNERSIAGKLKALFSLSYFQISLRALPKKIAGKNQPVATDERYNITNTLHPDGSLSYGKTYSASRIDEVRARVSLYVDRGELEDMGNLNSVSSEKWSKFTRLLSELQSRNIKVTLLLTPYHPLIYKKIAQRYPEGLKAEKLLNNLITDGIDIYGSFDPYRARLSERHFHDAIHCTEEGIRIILNRARQ